MVRDRVECERFRVFVQRAWPHYESAEFIPSPHIDVIADLLESVARNCYEGVKREVVINIPPRMSKSSLAQLWMAWVWTWWPASRWISVTYESGLSIDLSRKTMVLVQSTWYQSRWPTVLTKDAASHWQNMAGGWRLAIGTGGAVTGYHGDFHLIDDPVKEQLSRLGTPSMIASQLRKSSDFIHSTLATRITKPSAARVMIMQCLHRDDPGGEAKARGWESLVLPAHYDSTRADPRDPRTVDGELLCPDRSDNDDLDALARELGPAAASAQLEQLPIPPGGALLREDYLSHRYRILPVELTRALTSGCPAPGQRWGIYGDMTFKGKTSSDFVVLQLWCAWAGRFWLVDQIRGQWGYLDSKRQLKDFCARHPVAGAAKLEDAANAPALVDDIRSEIPGLQLAPVAGGCLARTQAVEGLWSSGAVMLPESAPWMGGGDGFVAEHLAFDGLGTRHDDQVACSSLALVDLGLGKGASFIAAMTAISEAR